MRGSPNPGVGLYLHYDPILHKGQPRIFGVNGARALERTFEVIAAVPAVEKLRFEGPLQRLPADPEFDTPSGNHTEGKQHKAGPQNASECVHTLYAAIAGRASAGKGSM